MPFQPGQSGNPRGRPKRDDYMTGLAKEHSLEALSTLVDWMRSDNAKASVAACSIILDRGYGKAIQKLEMKKEDPFEGMTADDLDAFADQLRANRQMVTIDGASKEIPEVGTLPALQETIRIS